MSFLKGRLSRVLSFAAFAVLVGGVSTYVAGASIPNAQGVIHACRLNTSGEVRIIDRSEDQDCVSQTETALQWGSLESGVAPTTYANRVSIDYDSQGSQTLVQVPGFGTISAYPCTTANSQNMNGYWQYTNTSGQTMEYYNPSNQALPQITNNSTFLELSPHIATLAPVSGSASKMASVLVHTINDEQNSKCHYRVMVTTTQ